MIAVISQVFGSAGINIASFKNKSNGKIGYNLIDLDTVMDSATIDALQKLDNVVKVRVLRF
jgi:D-3-phosphoglycerate dehydrogenase